MIRIVITLSNFRGTNMSQGWKIGLAAAITLALFVVLILLYANASNNAASKTALDFTQTQGEANNEENDRAVESAGIQTDIASESASDTVSRMQQYWNATGSTDSSKYKQTPSLQSPTGAGDIPNRQFSGTEGEARSDLWQEDLLRRASAELLPGQEVIPEGVIYNDECSNPVITRNAAGIIIEHQCNNEVD